MAKTKLELEGGEGWDRLTALFDTVLEKGGSIVQDAKAIGAAQKQAAQEVLAAQDKVLGSMKAVGQELIKNGSLAKQIDAEVAKSKQLAAAATLEQVKAARALTAEEQATLNKLSDLTKQFEALQKQAVGLEDMAKAIRAQGDGTGEAVEQTEELVRAREELNASLAANRAAAEEVAQALQPLVAAGGGLDIGESLAQGAQGVAVLKGQVEGVTKAQSDAEKVVKLTAEDYRIMTQQLASAGVKQKDMTAAVYAAKTGTEELEQAAVRTSERGFGTIRTRLRQATNEAALLLEKFDGEITPELVEAVREAARLKDQFGDINQIIDALHPEAKLTVVTQLATSIAGGFSAVTGLMALVDSESQKVQQTLTKIQAVMAISQGVNQFLAGFGDGLKALNTLVIANTTTTKANTLAKGQNATATGATTAATTASAGATGFLTTAVRGLTAAMAANPMLTAVVVLAGIASALLALGDDAETAKQQVDKLLGSMEKVRDSKLREISHEARMDELKNEEIALRKGNDLVTERELLEANLAVSRKEKEQNIALLKEQSIKLQEKEIDLINKAVAAGDIEFGGEGKRRKISSLGSDEDDQALADLVALRERFASDIETLNNEITENEAKAVNQRLAITDREIADQDKKRDEAIAKAKAEAALRIRMAEDVEKAKADLARNLAGGERAGEIADLEARAEEAARANQFESEAEFRRKIIALREETANENIDLIQRELQRKIALQQHELAIGVEAYSELTDLQKQAVADRLIVQGKANLGEAQMAELDMLRILARADSERALTKVTIAEVEKRVGAADEERGRQLALLNGQQELYDIRIEAANGGERKLLKIIQDAGLEGVESVRSTEEAKLLLAIQFAEKKVELLRTNGPLSAADSLEVDKLIAEIENLRSQLLNLKPFGIDWLKLLGASEEEWAKIGPIIQQGLQQLGQFVSQSLFADRIAEVDAFIAKLDEQISAQQEVLDREREAKDEGLTNDFAAQKAHQDNLLRLKREAAKEAEKIRKQEAIADAAAIVAKTVLTIIDLLDWGAKTGGPIGLAIAAAAVPGIFALLKVAKDQGKAVAQYAEGTDYVKRGNNPKGKDTVPAMLNEGEAVMRAEDNAANHFLIRGIHQRDPEQVRKGLAQTADNYGITWDELIAEFGPKARVRYDDLPDMPPIYLKDRIERKRIEAEDARAERAMSAAMEKHLSRLVSSNEEMLRIEKDRKDYVPLGPGKFRIIDRFGNTRTITIVE